VVSEEKIFFIEINQSETRIAYDGHVCKRIGMLPTKFQFIWPSGFRGEELKKKMTNQKQELPATAMFVSRSGRNEQSQ
jgi:hypothetical protein